MNSFMVLYDVDLSMAGLYRFHTIISGFSGIAPMYSCIQRTSVYSLSNHRDGKSTGFLLQLSLVVVSDLSLQGANSTTFLYHRVEVRKKW